MPGSDDCVDPALCYPNLFHFDRKAFETSLPLHREALQVCVACSL